MFPSHKKVVSTKENRRKGLEVMAVFVALMEVVVTVSQVYT